MSMRTSRQSMNTSHQGFSSLEPLDGSWRHVSSDRANILGRRSQQHGERPDHKIIFRVWNPTPPPAMPRSFLVKPTGRRALRAPRDRAHNGHTRRGSEHRSARHAPGGPRAEVDAPGGPRAEVRPSEPPGAEVVALRAPGAEMEPTGTDRNPSANYWPAPPAGEMLLWRRAPCTRTRGSGVLRGSGLAALGRGHLGSILNQLFNSARLGLCGRCGPAGGARALPSTALRGWVTTMGRDRRGMGDPLRHKLLETFSSPEEEEHRRSLQWRNCTELLWVMVSCSSSWIRITSSTCSSPNSSSSTTSIPNSSSFSSTTSNPNSSFSSTTSIPNSSSSTTSIPNSSFSTTSNLNSSFSSTTSIPNYSSSTTSHPNSFSSTPDPNSCLTSTFSIPTSWVRGELWGSDTGDTTHELSSRVPATGPVDEICTRGERTGPVRLCWKLLETKSLRARTGPALGLGAGRKPPSPEAGSWTGGGAVTSSSSGGDAEKHLEVTGNANRKWLLLDWAWHSGSRSVTATTGTDRAWSRDVRVQHDAELSVITANAECLRPPVAAQPLSQLILLRPGAPQPGPEAPSLRL
ncbi:hypothetical protein CRUP_011644 [Coryphaenoides rupestris]|nr:hypothetical protein CRUP_011644 [Coryphaenoides rupestris]